MRDIFPLAALLVVLLAPSIAFAGSGYKDFKFNITAEKLKAEHRCDVQKVASIGGVTTYACSNFLVGGQSAFIGFNFINNRLKRIAITAGDSVTSFMATFKALQDKYGMNHTRLDTAEIQAFDNGKREDLAIEWLKENILLTISKDSVGAVSVLVFYASADYEELYRKIKLDAIKNDL